MTWKKNCFFFNYYINKQFFKDQIDIDFIKLFIHFVIYYIIMWKIESNLLSKL